MKQGWEMKTLGDVCEKASSNVSQNQLNNEVGDYLIFGASGLIKKVSFYHREQPYLSIVKDGSGVGRVTKMEAYTSVIGTLQYILPKANVDLNYLYYSLISVDFKKYVAGAAIPHIYFKDYKNEPFLLAPLYEQQRIVSILDEIFANISKIKDNTEQNLKNAKELFENYLQTIFNNKSDDWESLTLGDIATFRNGMNFTKGSRGALIKIVGVRDFQKSFWVPLERLDSVTISGELTELDSLKEGDILAVRSNGNPELIGRTLLTGKVTDKITHSGFTIRIRLNSDVVLPKYICHNLKTTKTRRALTNSGTGVNIKSLNQGALSSLQISFPKSRIEQKSLVNKIEEMSSTTKRLEAIYEQKLNDLEELKKSVLQKAFNGELVTSSNKNEVTNTTQKIPSPYFRNQVHSAIVEQVVKDGGETTEVAVAKYDHLLQEVFGVNLGYQFETHLFGPFDATIKRLISSGLSNKNNWFTKRNGMIVVGTNTNALLSHPSNLYKDAKSAMSELAKLGITKLETDKIELLSTVCHAIKQSKSVDVQKIRVFMDNWETNNNMTKSQKFSLEQTTKCIGFILNKGLDKRLLEL